MKKTNIVGQWEDMYEHVDDYGYGDDDNDDDDDDVKACAVEMHMHGQGKDYFFLRANLKNIADTERAAVFVRGCGNEARMDRSEEPVCAIISTKNAVSTEGHADFVRACTGRNAHINKSKSHSLWETSRKKCCGHGASRRLCASQRKGNAHGHVKRAILYKNS